jgi:hypothetical protein
MDLAIAIAAEALPRRFLWRWMQTILWPAVGCGLLAAVLIRDDLRLDDGAFIYLLGLPVAYWFLVGLLQGRLLGGVIAQPWAWAAYTWGGGSLALIGGFAMFGALTLWIATISPAGYDYRHPIALLPFESSGMAAGAILGLFQAVALRADWRDRGALIVCSAAGGAIAVLILWAGVNLLTIASGRGHLELAQGPFLAGTAGFLLAGALQHNLLTGLALSRFLKSQNIKSTNR